MFGDLRTSAEIYVSFSVKEAENGGKRITVSVFARMLVETCDVKHPAFVIERSLNSNSFFIQEEKVSHFN